jgi:hypothetical protein
MALSTDCHRRVFRRIRSRGRSLLHFAGHDGCGNRIAPLWLVGVPDLKPGSLDQLPVRLAARFKMSGLCPRVMVLCPSRSSLPVWRGAVITSCTHRHPAVVQTTSFANPPPPCQRRRVRSKRGA